MVGNDDVLPFHFIRHLTFPNKNLSLWNVLVSSKSYLCYLLLILVSFFEFDPKGLYEGF